MNALQAKYRVAFSALSRISLGEVNPDLIAREAMQECIDMPDGVEMCEGCDKEIATTRDSEGILLCEACAKPCEPEKTAKCTRCGKDFTPEEPHHTTCADCCYGGDRRG